jgi:peptide/nickel transport system substrate-binding protein
MSRLRVLLLLFLISIIPLRSIQAQNDGVIVIGVVGSGDTLDWIDPVTCTGDDACVLATLLFPRFLGIDPVTQNFAPGAPGNSLVEDWSVSEDGMVYTFTMRSDRVWSDGVPVTADDVLFTYEARDVGSGLFIDDVSVLDRYTVQVEYNIQACDIPLHNWSIPILPAHAYDYDPDTVEDHPFNLSPSITSGPFRFGERTSDELILIADDGYANGGVTASELHVVRSSDLMEQVDRFLSGEINFISGPARQMVEVLGVPGVQSYTFPGRDWNYIGLNLADPTDPQPGYSGTVRIDQGHHPIFGDLQVRRALQHGLNIQEIIDQAVAGQGTPMASFSVPLSWTAHPTLAPVVYDPQKAESLLEIAGWVMGPNGVRVADGARYARDGTELRFTLMTNTGNTVREVSAGVIRDQLAEIGVAVEIEVVDFIGLLDRVFGQTHDAVLMDWRDSFPTETIPPFFQSDGDSPADGLNYTSYYNPRLDDLVDAAAVVPYCDLDPRIAISHEAQQVVHHDQPYLFLYTPNIMVAARDIEGFAPYPNLPFWNIDEWQPKAPQP